MPDRVDLDDVIAAPATPPGPGARGVVRVSGGNAVAIVAGLSSEPLPTEGSPRRVVAEFTTSIGAVPVDLLCWPTRRSYTGQPTVEIHTIGSPVLLEAICESLYAAAARPARPGEFTMRAFLNGRIDLGQAEAVRAVIDADRRDDLDVALTHLAGGPSRRIVAVRDDLLGLLAEIEAALDFADEDIEVIAKSLAAARLDDAASALAALAGEAAGRHRDGSIPEVAFVGPPNAGKSSLVNALAGRDAAIVTPVAGTTRDTVTVETEISGRTVRLVDTAGHEESGDDLAAAMRTATADAMGRADLVVVCRSPDTEAVSLPEIDRPMLEVATKSDLAERGESLAVSTVSGEGLDRLAEAIGHRLADSKRPGVVGARTAASLGEATARLRDAARLNEADAGGELVAAEVRAALDALAVIGGAVDVDDVLDVVFGSFCIGK